MEFRPRGELRYAVPVDGREHVIALLYRVEGDVLRTDNPAAPHATASNTVTPRTRPKGLCITRQLATRPPRPASSRTAYV